MLKTVGSYGRVLPRRADVRGDALANGQQPIPVPRPGDARDDEALHVSDVLDLLVEDLPGRAAVRAVVEIRRVRVEEELRPQRVPERRRRCQGRVQRQGGHGLHRCDRQRRGEERQGRREHDELRSKGPGCGVDAVRTSARLVNGPV